MSFVQTLSLVQITSFLKIYQSILKVYLKNREFSDSYAVKILNEVCVPVARRDEHERRYLALFVPFIVPAHA